jgi:hypothetical protein
MRERTPLPRQDDIVELRASVDVMFEALAHIQASLTGSTPDEHESAYQQFKRALYDRYEHALARRREGAVPAAPRSQSDEQDEDRRAASASTSGQGDGMSRGDQNAPSLRSFELEASPRRDRSEGEEGAVETHDAPTLWPND